MAAMAALAGKAHGLVIGEGEKGSHGSGEPAYIAHRIRIFDELKEKYDSEIAQRERKEIEVSLPVLKSTKIGRAWDTSPMHIAKELANGEERIPADKWVIAKVDGALWDLLRPLESSCSLEFFDFDSPEGKRVFWHSSAHVLGEAAEKFYGGNLCIGPPTDEGFFYEMGIDGRVVTHEDYKPLENIAASAIKERQRFVRLVISKNDLLDMFKHNKYKQHIIKDKIPDNTSTTVYRCGPLIDLCVGPHVPDTGKIKAFSILKNSASYFLGNAQNDSLQRIYGVSFPDKERMREHKHFLEEAAKRDHRKIGKEQELYFFHELSPGNCFWQPHGARIYNTLIDFIKTEYRKRGFNEVITPNMYNSKLWETSGHWENYKDDMFTFDVEKEKFGLKPMNCPGHCLLFKQRERSYRELPLRIADFGVLHRNEFSGALTGLTRVRRFQQDDAHIFCTEDQVRSEVLGCLDFLKHVYGILGFTYKLALSTRPQKYLGSADTWDNAEKQLEGALNTWGDPWGINMGDGAFYGPKVDISVSDALRRQHQCATIQLDFQLPQRFELEYHAAVDADNEKQRASQYSRPVMIHRAILGSVERLTAILVEHFAGKWPFWLSPRQVLIIPVTGIYQDYASSVHQRLHDAGLFVDLDFSDNTLNKKIRSGQLTQYNFIFSKDFGNHKLTI